MYNLYIYEKQILEGIKKKSEEIYRKKFKLRRQKELINLSQNYDNRIKKFIDLMKDKSINLRKNSSEENLNKTFNKKKFLFGEYKTERKRLEELESYKNELKGYQKERDNINKKRILFKIKNNRNFLLIQPEMKFTSKIKLEKKNGITRKKELFKNNLLNTPLLEKYKKSEYLKEKKMKEFYNFIDKDYLNDNYIKKTIEDINDIEENELKIQYTSKDYIAWKYFGDIIYNNFDNKIGKLKKKENKNDILEDLNIKENEDAKFSTNSGFQTHFKGSSQYLEMKKLKEQREEKERKKKLEILKRNRIKNINESSLDKAIRFTLRLLNKEKAIRKEKLIQDKLNFESSKTMRNSKEYMGKNPLLTKKVFSLNRSQKNLIKNDHILNELSETCKRRKLKMDHLINKELEKSLTKQFMKKYNSLRFFDNMVLIPKEYDFEVDNNFDKTNNDDNNDKDSKEKIKLLVDQIIKEKRQLNDKNYYEFVKKFSRSIFGFKKKMKKKN